MDNEKIYKDLLERIIESEQSLYGRSTVNMFREISGLQVSDDGKVLAMSGDFGNIISEIIVKFERLDGKLSLGIIKGVAGAYKSLYPDVDLPEM